MKVGLNKFMTKRLLCLWVALLSVTGLISSWFALQTIREVYKYVRLNTKASAEIVKWEIKAFSASHYALAATYHYTVGEQDFTGYTILTSSYYPNYYAAESQLKAQKNRFFPIWYQKNHPSYSSLQKNFPKKECVNALLTSGIFLYFYFIRRNLRTQQTTGS